VLSKYGAPPGKRAPRAAQEALGHGGRECRSSPAQRPLGLSRWPKILSPNSGQPHARELRLSRKLLLVVRWCQRGWTRAASAMTLRNGPKSQLTLACRRWLKKGKKERPR